MTPGIVTITSDGVRIEHFVARECVDFEELRQAAIAWAIERLQAVAKEPAPECFEVNLRPAEGGTPQ